MKKPIKFRPELFWDIDVKTLDPDKYPRYVIERVLDLGDMPEVRWLLHYYPATLIKEILRNSKAISHKSKALWSLVI